ncbi:MAG: hypothetical protein C9356_09235 [Oleiphilus sp.]|nr:MAG: hypothetical protein C9356_09235 [Oleiphilus sp.]
MASITFISPTQEFLYNVASHMEDSSQSKAYESTFAGGDSGLSYGELQSDVAANDLAEETFNDILKASGLFSDAEADELTKKAAKKGAQKSNFTSEELSRIDQALSSPQGKQLINERDNEHYQEYLTKWIDKANQAGGSNQNGKGVFDPTHPDYLEAQAMIAAWANRTGEPDKLSEYLSGGTVFVNDGQTELTMPGEPTLEAIEEYLKNQTQFRDEDQGGNGEDFDSWKDRIQDAIDHAKNETPNPDDSNWDGIPDSGEPNENPDDIYEPPTPEELGGIDDLFDKWFDLASWQQNNSPLVFDLDGDGIEHAGISDGVLFDLDSDGIKESIGWVSGEDGLLALDKNSNGLIDNGQELFGNVTTLSSGVDAQDGFEALAEYDLNGDAIIDASDVIFSQLKMWVDSNSDGISQSSELFSLSDVGISSISTTSDGVRTDFENGNYIEGYSTYELNGGNTGIVGDVFFDVDTFRSEFISEVEIPSELYHVANLAGSGAVRSLGQAATLNSTLVGVYEDFVAATTLSERNALVDQIIFEWFKTSDFHNVYERIDSTTGGSEGADRFSRTLAVSEEPTYLDKVAIAEAFNGRVWSEISNQQDAAESLAIGDLTGESFTQAVKSSIDNVYAILRQSVFRNLILECSFLEYKSLWPGLVDGELSSSSFDELDAAIDVVAATSPEKAAYDLVALIGHGGDFAQRVGWDPHQKLRTLLSNNPSVVSAIQQSSDKTAIFVSSGTLQVDASNHLLSQSALIFGRDGTDSIDVILGDALSEGTVYGGAGDDIVEVLGAGYTKVYGDDGNDNLSVLSGEAYLLGGDGDDTISSMSSEFSVLDGGAGSDDITASVAAGSKLLGGYGDDALKVSILISGAAESASQNSYTFEGGAGDDTIEGASGADTYIFRIGDGHHGE